MPAAHTNRDVAVASIPVNLIEQCLAHQKAGLDSAHTIGARVFFLRDPRALSAVSALTNINPAHTCLERYISAEWIIHERT